MPLVITRRSSAASRADHPTRSAAALYQSTEGDISALEGEFGGAGPRRLLPMHARACPSPATSSAFSKGPYKRRRIGSAQRARLLAEETHTYLFANVTDLNALALQTIWTLPSS